MLHNQETSLTVLYLAVTGVFLCNIDAFSPSHGISCLKLPIKILALPNEMEVEKDKADWKYIPPKFSASFLAHMKEVKEQKLGKYADTNAEGIQCDGEPPIDPSRLVQDDGIDSEYLNEYNDR